MIYLSASSIKDFISCERKYWYRRFASDRRATSIEAETGTVVHKAIEKYWNKPKQGYNYLSRYKEPYDSKKAVRALDTFYDKFQSLLSKDDLVEHEFSLPYSVGVDLIGMFDRVTPMGIIYDWKTNNKLPVNLSSDPQFILYYYAYKNLHGKPPASLYFASLKFGRLVKFNYNKTKEDILLKEIIPDMLEHIDAEKFNPTGVFRFTTCKYCFFKEHCHKSLGLEDKSELDSTQFNFG
jgi:RecB family exonuclease